jgi:diguanylate cyclase (GGDEF)-like protein/PAS domain S-box-containing protein
MKAVERFRSLSLKTKLALSGAISMLVVVAAMTSVALWALRQDVRESIADAQSSLIRAVANEIDRNINERVRLLALGAGVLSRPHLMSTEELHAHFSTRPALNEHFDVVFVADLTGRIIYDTPELPGRRGNTVANREYFKLAAIKGEPAISEPLSGKTTYEPNIVMATPLRSPSGKLIGMMGGILFLSRPNFLSALGQARIGTKGYFSLITKGDNPIIVMHGQRDRIMKPAPDARSSPLLARALKGEDGTMELVNSVGFKGIFSSRNLTSVPWVLVTAYPTSEAFASLQARERDILVVGVLLALLSGVVVWWYVRRLLVPLDQLSAAMHARIGNLNGATDEIDVDSAELAKVVAAYKALVEEKLRSRAALLQSEMRLRSVLTHAGDAFISIDTNGVITEWNRQAEATFGWRRSEAIGQRLVELLIPHDQRERHLAGMRRFDIDGTGPVVNNRMEVLGLHQSGRQIPVELSIAVERSASGIVSHAFLRDISERKAAEQKLAESERRMRTVSDNLPMLIAYIDKDQIFRFGNGTAKEWLGIKTSSLIDHHVAEVMTGNLYEQQRSYIERALAGERVDFELESAMPGATRQLQIVYIPDKSEDGSVAGVYTLCTDITRLKEVERTLGQMARFDSLTGLPNRQHLLEKLTEAIGRSRRSGMPMAVFYLDVDHFKTVNDTLGHAAGDELLKEFANRLKECVRGTDTVARLGGDEFVILLEGLHVVEETSFVAQKIITAMNKELVIDGQRLEVSTSIGIAFSGEDGVEPTALLAKADKALYQAKRDGRNRFRLAT